MDINDNRPAFYPVLYTVSLSTHSSPGTSVVKVTANDPDSGANGRVTYRTVPGGGSAFFTLNKDTGTVAAKHSECMIISVSETYISSSTGVISLSRSLHGKANTVISMEITAEDGGGLTAAVNARVNVSVVGGSVTSPVFEQAQYFFTVSEDVLRGTPLGVVRASAKTGEGSRFLLADGVHRVLKFTASPEVESALSNLFQFLTSTSAGMHLWFGACKKSYLSPQ